MRALPVIQSAEEHVGMLAGKNFVAG